MREDGKIKESVFAIGDYASAPSGETPEEAKARRDGRRFTLTEARDERTKARALVKQGINPAQQRQLAQAPESLMLPSHSATMHVFEGRHFFVRATSSSV